MRNGQQTDGGHGNIKEYVIYEGKKVIYTKKSLEHSQNYLTDLSSTHISYDLMKWMCNV